MIHLTVAAPMGIDSVFFSFIERLAVQNGHVCVDLPAESFDNQQTSTIIERMRTSSEHFFLIGFRYPPVYWKFLFDRSSTVCMLADPDGIARQVETIQCEHHKLAGPRSIELCISELSHALEPTLELAELILSEIAFVPRILPLASSFYASSRHSFSRLELFYSKAGVKIESSCSEEFSDEAIPFLSSRLEGDIQIRLAIQKALTLEDCTPSRINAIYAIFGIPSGGTSAPFVDTLCKDPKPSLIHAEQLSA